MRYLALFTIALALLATGCKKEEPAAPAPAPPPPPVVATPWCQTSHQGWITFKNNTPHSFAGYINNVLYAPLINPWAKWDSIPFGSGTVVLRAQQVSGGTASYQVIRSFSDCQHVYWQWP